MSSNPREEKAQRWLSEQIEQLKALRTSNVRDTEFKQWRQSTLTMIQRIWPGEGKRSARFRRVPFSPPSSQASQREAREVFERGCAEAAQLLRSYLDDVAEGGLPAESAQARPASLDPGVAEDDFPTLDLPGGPEKPAGPSEPAGEAPAAPGAVSVRGTGGAGSRRSGPERRKKQTKNGPRRRLRDMLGLDALERLTKNDDPAEPAEEPMADPDFAEPADADDEAPVLHSDDGEEHADADRPAEEAEPAVANGAHLEPDDAGEAWPGDGGDSGDGMDDEVPFTADQFLSASPIFKSEGKPVRRAKRDTPAGPAEAEFGPASLSSGTAMAVAAIAAEVTRLGVPEGQRARTRAALIDLAQRLEDGRLEWDDLRGAVAFAMEFPPIGRRLVPLLIPFLDRAA